MIGCYRYERIKKMAKTANTNSAQTQGTTKSYVTQLTQAVTENRHEKTSS